MDILDNSDCTIPSSLVSLEGLKGMLSGPSVKGVGPVFATKIADKFGKEILSPDFDAQVRLREITGLGEAKISEISGSIRKATYPLEAVAMLYSAGLSDVEVTKITSHYKKKLARALLEDPYDMVENAWKVSFFTADKLGRWMGIAADDPRRIRGALLTAIKFYAEKGSLYATVQQAVKTAASLCGIPEEKIIPQISVLVDEERLNRTGEGLYLPVFYLAEKEAARKLVQLMRNFRPDEITFDIPETDFSGNPLNDGQKTAIRTVMENPVTIITGGPGTGKTTAIRGMIRMFEDAGKKVVLAAPTGRAAKRMSDLSGFEAKTIHRLLGYSMGRGYRNKRFDADVLIIDEASMLEQVMFRHLLDALGDRTKIVLVGDTNQLPSIGAGDVLNQLMSSGVVPIVHLTENFRQKAGSLIAATAEAIRTGQSPDSSPVSSGEDFIMLEEDGTAGIKSRLLQLVEEEIPSMCGIDPKDIQVVTPQQEGPLGAKELNIEIQERVNPDGLELKRGVKRFRLGDRVMQTSNSSERNVYNGEAGWVSDVNREAGILDVTFYDGKKLSYDKTQLKELSLAYATTVHKLQGSETDYMVMVLASTHRPLLYRNLLYTGVSRAKKLCVLLGEGRAVDAAVSNDSPAVRHSNFKECLLLGMNSKICEL